MTGDSDKRYRRRQTATLGVGMFPVRSSIDRPMIVDGRVREEARAKRVIGVVVAEHNVGHVFGR
jgi:hypothetical protein